MTGVDSSARDRAIELLQQQTGNVFTPIGALTAHRAVEVLLANPEVLRALAGVPAPDADVVREEWAVWDPTHTSDPNDEAARVRPVQDRADAEDYVLMPKAKRVRIARKLVTEGP